MHAELCICSLMPKLATNTKISLLLHFQESFKPSNTGRLAHLCLPNSAVFLRGNPEERPDPQNILIQDRENLLLHLADDSIDLTKEFVQSLDKPVNLIVPDGTWAQASRAGRRLSEQLKGQVRSVKLRIEPGRPSIYRLRSEHHPDGMATFEAILRALEVLEGPHVRAPMEKIFRIMTDRVLWTRGKLAAEDVFGGLPTA